MPPEVSVRFSAWQEQPDAIGLWHFDGVRHLHATNMQVRVNDLVELFEDHFGKETRILVGMMSRGKKHPLEVFHGRWRRLFIDFEGERI